MAYLDFDTLVICNNDFSEDFLLSCFDFFHELGIRNFIFTYDFDVANRPVSTGLETLRTLKPYLQTLKPRGVRIYTAMNVILSKDVAYNKDLARLTIPHTDRLFINLPLFDEHPWLESDLAHLVYRKKLSPMFTSFERNAITYDDTTIERFSRLPGTVFCVDANYMFSLRSQAKLTLLLKAGARILPSISNKMSDYVAVLQGYEDLKSRLGVPLYRELCKNIWETGTALRRDFAPIKRS